MRGVHRNPDSGPRVSLDDDGTLDDFMAEDVKMLHFEALDRAAWYGTVELSNGEVWQLHFGAKKARAGYARAELVQGPPKTGQEATESDETAEVVREVLQHHRLEAGTGYCAGEIVCTGCHHVLGDATQHLVNVVEQALNPGSQPPQPQTGTKTDYRESAIEWRTA